ncbi:MAG: hypothetical protein CMJ24_09285 [Phycisphaerae bacterium]|nr:hypothetical protein [Phycisphaerae bacterium]
MKKNMLFASCLMTLLVASTTLAASLSYALSNGSTWRGKTDDHVVVEYNFGATNSTVEGVLTDKSTGDYMVLKKDDGGDEMLIHRTDIVSIALVGDDAPASAPAEAPKRGSEPKPAVQTTGGGAAGQPTSTPVADADAPGVFYLPLREMVGLEFRPEEISAIIAEADAVGPGQTIVLDIESGGGSVWEFIVLAQIIKDAKQRHQIVAWVGHAISAAAGTALCCDRLIWKSHGALGAITMHSGGQPVSDMMEEKWVTLLKSILRESGHSEHWARPMVRNDSWISYTKDSDTGDCEWYGTPQGIQGEIVLSNLGENVVLNREQAIDCCLAEAVADRKEELAVILDLPSWNEIGTGQKMSDDWIETCARCETYWRKSNAELGRLGGYAPIVAIKKRLDIYKRWLRWWKQAPNKMGMLGAPRIQQLERMIEELEQQLKNMSGRG